MGFPRLRYTAKSRVVSEEKLAGMQGFRLEGRAVGRNEPPMTDLTAQQVDGTKRRKILANSGVRKISDLRKDEPHTVVFRVLWTVSQNEHDLLSCINGETGKHGPYFGLEGIDGFDDERVGGRSALGLGQPGDSAASWHNARIARRNRTPSTHAFPNPGGAQKLRVGVEARGGTSLIENAMTPALLFSAPRLWLPLVFLEKRSPVSKGMIVSISRA
jgi:hypothetical protein